MICIKPVGRLIQKGKSFSYLILSKIIVVSDTISLIFHTRMRISGIETYVELVVLKNCSVWYKSDKNLLKSSYQH